MNFVNFKRSILEIATLVGAAALCAFVANQSASRERRLALPGNYKDAMTVPARPRPEAPVVDGSVTPGSAAPSAAAPGEMATEAPATSTTAEAPNPTRTGSEPASTGSRVTDAQPGTPAASRSTRVRESASAASSAALPAARATAAPEPLTKRFPPHPDKPFVEVTGDDVIWLHARGALVLDARRTSVFSEGHIAAARPVSVWEADVDEKVLSLLNEGRSQREPIVVYCAGGDCEDSHMLSQKLFGAGFDNVLVYRDGWPDWQKRGGPSRTGAVP